MAVDHPSEGVGQEGMMADQPNELTQVSLGVGQEGMAVDQPNELT